MNTYIVTSHTYPAMQIAARTPDVAARKYCQRFSTRKSPFIPEQEGDDSYTMRETDGTKRDTCYVRKEN